MSFRILNMDNEVFREAYRASRVANMVFIVTDMVLKAVNRVFRVPNRVFGNFIWGV